MAAAAAAAGGRLLWPPAPPSTAAGATRGPTYLAAPPGAPPLPLVLARASSAIHQQREEQEQRERVQQGIEAQMHSEMQARMMHSSSEMHNPLRRLERLGCGWLAVVVEWEGVLAEAADVAGDAADEAWRRVAEEAGLAAPPGFALRRARGMKAEQAVAEVLCWSRHPSRVRQLALRRHQVADEMCGGRNIRLAAGAVDLLRRLAGQRMPAALVSTLPRWRLDASLAAAGLSRAAAAPLIRHVVCADDVERGKPEPDMYIGAAARLGYPAARCIVVGGSNASVEAAHEACMKCVAVSSAASVPVYELGAADLVVRSLSRLSLLDLKKLADIDITAEFHPTLLQQQVQAEEEEDDDGGDAAHHSVVAAAHL